MTGKIVAVWVSVAMLFGFVVIFIEIAPMVTAYTPHDPIRINNNTDFVTQGWPGSGIITDPWVIEGFEIDGTGYSNCIYISNTTDYFTVRDCYLHNVDGIYDPPYDTCAGLALFNVTNGIIKNNTLSSNNRHGFYIYYSNGNFFSNNNPSWNGWYGFIIYHSDNNIVVNNSAHSNSDGIFVYYSDDNTILNNTCKSNSYGIFLSSSNGNYVSDNNVSSNNQGGIYLGYAQSNTIANNTISKNNNFGIDLKSDSNDNIVINNTIYLNTGESIFIESSHRNKIIKNTINPNNGNGIYLDSSNQNSIVNNTINSSTFGLFLHTASRNTIINNTISNSSNYGMYSRFTSERNTISDNTFYMNKKKGIHLDSNSNYVKIINNNISYSNEYAIYLSSSVQAIIQKNTMIENGIILLGNTHAQWTLHSIDTSNTVNGKPLRYWKNKIGGTVPFGAGQVILANCHNVVVSDQNLSNASLGIELGFSDNNIINNNTVNSNQRGIYLYTSDSNIITENNVSWNVQGIRLESSNDNTIYHNDILNNTKQASDDTNNGNQWDEDYPSGGNYWSDYGGIDNYKGPSQAIPGSDGIGDTPYVIDSNSHDRYPLMEPYSYQPITNYTILKQGWNLISVPLIQDNTNLTKVLEMIDGWYNAVQWHDPTESNDPWKHYQIGKPLGNDLFELNETMSFWIHITQPGDTIFLYNGTQPTVNQTIPLHPGWNMVGYPSLTSYNRTDGLNNLTFNDQVDAIWSYDAAIQKWEEMGESDYFQIGRGYYIHAKSVCEWEVPL